MALSRIGSSADLANLFVRSSYAATSPRHGRQNVEKLHASTIRRYPEAPQIPLPSNVSEIFNIETSRFAPERARDISTPLFMYNSNPEKFSIGFNASSMSHVNSSSIKMQQMDSHADSYDCFGAVSLSSSMQTNVPKPFCASGKSNYLNMPGGQWSRDNKYIAESMKKSQFTVGQMRQMKRSGMLDGLHLKASLAHDIVRCYSTETKSKGPLASRVSAEMQEKRGDEGVTKVVKQKDEDGGRGGATTAAASTVATSGATVNKSDGGTTPPPAKDFSKAEKFKIIVRHYGKTVIVFHVTISLISLGIFYSLVSSGLDLTPIIKVFSGPTPEATEVSNAAAAVTATASEISDEAAAAAAPAKDDDPLVKTIMSQGSTFLIAYAIHKLFAPIRLSITLGFTPMLVKYLRRKGILKLPKKPAATPT